MSLGQPHGCGYKQSALTSGEQESENGGVVTPVLAVVKAVQSLDDEADDSHGHQNAEYGGCSLKPLTQGVSLGEEVVVDLLRRRPRNLD